ncbi:MAG TPA: hypothetical protein VHD31_02375 [Candidatus Paceibacterota bacterium]|nr:hypothetical protein [Candidatus Paceibacterota bacterium]
MMRFIAELDGSYPGISLYEIVTTRIEWDHRPSMIGRERKQYLRFYGKYSEEVKAVFETRPTDKPGSLPYENSLTLKIQETVTSRLIFHCHEDDRSYGNCKVSLSMKIGDNQFPIVGYPQERVVQHSLRERFNGFIGPFKLPEGVEYLLEGVECSSIFLSLATLGLSVCIDKDVYLKQFPTSLKSLSGLLEEAIRKTNWGD